MAQWLTLIAVVQQISCAGGGGSPINNNLNSSPAVIISVSPASAQITAGTSVQFLATVENASNPAVTWQVNGISGGNSSVGTITPSGAATASYLAPTSVPSTLMVTVAAVLQVDPTTAGSAIVTINELPGAQMTVSPVDPTIVAGKSLQFSVTVQGGPQAVIWEVNNIPGGSAASGTISSSGFYAAPLQIPNPPLVNITALLFSDSSVSASTKLTIVPPIATINISPSTANVITGQTLQFSASEQNSSSPLTWQVNGIVGGNATVGTIISSVPGVATFTAPLAIPPIPNPFTVTLTAALQTDSSILSSAGVTIISANTLGGVYSWKNDSGLTGQNTQETLLTPSSVSSTTSPTFKKLFSCGVDGQIFAQPLYVANVTVGNVTHNVAYVATEHDSVYAFDADANPCQTLWQVAFINPNAGVSTVPATDIPGQTDIALEIGITGTPVIDPATATLYVVAKTKENGTYVQRLHALDLTTGAEKFGGPAMIQSIVSGTGTGTNVGTISFASMSLTENQRSALLLIGGNVYIAFDSYSDIDPFHGWLFAYDAGDLRAAPVVFISTPDGSRAGIGGSGAAPSSDLNGNIFVVTSYGTTGMPNTSDHPDMLLKLRISTAQASLSILDSFTRANEVSLHLQQKYFGSTGVLLLPGAAGVISHPNLAVAGDEAADVYLLDRDNLATGALQTLSLGGAIFGTPAYWAGNNTVYAAAAGDNLRALPLSGGMLTSPLCSQPGFCSTDVFPLFGASPVISWDGNNTASGIVWALDTSGYLAVPRQPAILYAYKATDLTKLFSSPASPTDPLAAGAAVKFTVPTVANGKVYIGTQNELSVFGLQ